jgi:hypothetical protein
MKSKPLTVRFGGASFSACLLVEFKRTDPSHPWIKMHNISLSILA